MKNKNRIYSGADPDQIAADLAPLLDLQDKGMPLDQLAGLIESCLIPHFVRYDLPEFHSLFNFFPEEGAALGAGIALKYNQGVTNWQVSPGGVMLEELCCKALCRLYGLTQSADATFMYSGTYANQEALFLAIHRKAEQCGFDFCKLGLSGFENPERLAVITSREAHFSIDHAVRMLGLGEQSIITLNVDKNRRIDVEEMKNTLASVQKTHDVFCAVITAGTTCTGSVDPVRPVIDICNDKSTWIHVDAAYGLAYSLIPEYRHLFNGIDKADSITWDPHKQFGVPIPSSILFVNNGEDFNRISVFGDYFNRKDDDVPNPGLKSPPSTRPLTALSLVTTLRHLGMNSMIERLSVPLTAIKNLAKRLEKESDIEVMHKPDLGILCIRIVPERFPSSSLDQLQLYIYNRVMQEGKRAVSTSRIDGKAVLRILSLSPNISYEILLETVYYLRALAEDYEKK
ncbi:pyridoxal phosphate-dependent decarboxylase family protein [candidate division KSB1 bacterium]